MRGEHSQGPAVHAGAMGSSPHARGTLLTGGVPIVLSRVRENKTPESFAWASEGFAHAGPGPRGGSGPRHLQKPRLCGDVRPRVTHDGVDHLQPLPGGRLERRGVAHAPRPAGAAVPAELVLRPGGRQAREHEQALEAAVPLRGGR